MSRDEAITVERQRYVRACSEHRMHMAHIHRLALDRLRYPYRIRR